MSGLRKLAFTPCSVEPSTAFRVTSLPVPAVVGTAMNGKGEVLIVRPLPITSRNSSGSPPLVAIAAIAFPASIALPPPIDTITSQPALRMRFTPSRTNSTVGSLGTANASAASAEMSHAARSVEAPVTTMGRVPNVRTNSGRPAAVPSPKMICVAVANSKRTFLPALRIGKNCVESGPLARLSHHVRHRIPPLRVMSGFSVCGCSIRRAIGLDQHEFRFVVLLLDYIEARDTRFLNAVASILDRGPPELCDRLGFYLHMHMNDKHQMCLHFLS